MDKCCLIYLDKLRRTKQKIIIWRVTILEIPDEIMKEIRESGYDQELVYTYIRELLDSDKEYDV